jgi:hypothetical protein
LGEQKDKERRPGKTVTDYRDFVIDLVRSPLVTHEIAGSIAASGSDFYRQYSIPQPEGARIAEVQALKIQTDKLPGLIAEGIRLYEEDKEKKENTWPRRLQRYAKWIVEAVVIAAVGVFVGWYMALYGFKA